MLNDDLLRIVVTFAWGTEPTTTDTLSRQASQSMTASRFLDMLDCALDCQQNIPPWFLNDVQLAFTKIHNAPLPLSHLKRFNPLVLGAAFSPFDPSAVRLNCRSMGWLFQALTPQYLRGKKMLRKPLYRFLDQPVLKVWNRLLAKIGDVTHEDIHPRGYMKTLITNVMVEHLPCASPIGNWARRFAL